LPEQNALSVAELVAAAARHIAEDDAAAALAALGQAAASDPGNFQLHVMTALVAWYLGDTARALSLAKSGFDREPGNGTVAEIVASLLAQVGELVESLYYGKLAIALPPDPALAACLPPRFPLFHQAFLSIRDKPLLAQARLSLVGGRLTAALDKARQHVEVAPDDEEGRRFYAETLLRAGRAAAAVEVLAPPAAATMVAPAVASLIGRARAAVGDEEARQWHERAVAAAPEDAAVAAQRIADAAVLGAPRRQREPWIKDWLHRFARSGKARHWRSAGDKLVIGYLVSHVADRRDAAAIAAVAQAHNRANVGVIGYGLGAQSWEENAAFRGAFDKWRDVAGLDPATLAKTFGGDGVDAIIDAGGMRSPENLRALARVNSAVRVAWLCDWQGLERQIYDAAVAPRSARSEGEIDLWQPSCGAYPLLRDWTRGLQPSGGGREFCFASDLRLSQLGAETVSLWRAVLEAAPQASLLLRANDMAPGPNIARLIARFGTELAARIDIVEAPQAESFWHQVDVGLAPLVAETPRLAAEAAACGVPVVALQEAGADGAMLSDLGLGALVAAKPAAYVASAAELARAPAKRAEAAAAAAVVAGRGEALAGEIARSIERAARVMLGKVAA
jgi:hypothetical protein